MAETVENVRKQQGLAEMSPMRRLSPAGYQRRHGEKEDVSTGEALAARRRNPAEEATAITVSGKCRSRQQGDGSGRSTVDGRAAKRARREGPGPVSTPLVNDSNTLHLVLRLDQRHVYKVLAHVEVAPDLGVSEDS